MTPRAAVDFAAPAAARAILTFTSIQINFCLYIKRDAAKAAFAGEFGATAPYLIDAGAASALHPNDELISMETLPPMRAIQAFEAVARCGSVAAAADELGVSPGAISQQLHKIEADLNVRLFYREGRTLKLTSWGLTYYPEVRAAFDQLRHAQHALKLARTKRSMVLSALPSLSSWLRRHVIGWREIHPGVSVTVLGTDKESPLHEDGIDFRLCYGTDARKYDRFAELFIDAVTPACSPDLLRRHSVRTEADIIAAPLIDIAWEKRHRSPPTWADWAWSAGLGARETTSTLAFSQADAAIDAALSGGGFVLGPLSMIADHVRQGRLVVPIDRRLTMPEPYYLAWDRDTLDRPLAAGLRTALIAAGRQQSALSSGKDSLIPARQKS